MGKLFNSICVLSLIATCGGCGQKSGEISTTTSPNAVPVAFNVTHAPTIEFNVPDMMCPEGCGEATRGILADQEGVVDVKIDFPAKLAIVAVESEKFDANKALSELIDHGFDKSTIKTDSAR